MSDNYVGEILVRRGALTPAQLEAAITSMQDKNVTLTEEGRSTRRAVAEAVGCLVPAFVEASSDLPELLSQLHEVTHNMRQLTTDLRSA